MLTIDKIKNEHLIAFIPLDGQEEEFETLFEIYYNSNEPHGFCFLKDGIPVLLIGLKQKWHRVFDTFTVFSKSWKPVYYKTVVKESNSYFRKLDCDRIEHLIRCDRPWTDKMAKLFGFKYNTTFHKYCNGQDFKLYEVVK